MLKSKVLIKVWIPEFHPKRPGSDSGHGARGSVIVTSCPGDSDLYQYLRIMFYNQGMYFRLSSIKVYISASSTTNFGGSVYTHGGERKGKWGV